MHEGNEEEDAEQVECVRETHRSRGVLLVATVERVVTKGPTCGFREKGGVKGTGVGCDGAGEIGGRVKVRYSVDSAREDE